MAYLNCPRCGLSLTVRAHDDVRAPEDATHVCPRCRGQAGVTVPMYLTDRPRPPATPAAEPKRILA